MQILFALLGLSALVIVHEGGHYLLARAFGMRVLRFSVGFGPTIARYQPKDSPTVFQVGLIPFMAYVQIAGMNPAEENDPNDPGLFQNKSVFARFSAIFAGPFANYLAASAIVLGMALAGHHLENPPREPMTVGKVISDSPAREAGIRPGDVFVEAEGQPVRRIEDLIAVTKQRAGVATRYVVERAGQRIPLTITPRSFQGKGAIGVEAEVVPTPMAFGPALKYSVVYPWLRTKQQLEGMAMMIRERTTQGLVGPVGMVNELAASSSLMDLIDKLVLISVALGMFNLLPLPGLDGGRLVFLGYEIITRRRANERIEALVHTVGLVLLLCIIALVTLRDVTG